MIIYRPTLIFILSTLMLAGVACNNSKPSAQNDNAEDNQMQSLPNSGAVELNPSYENVAAKSTPINQFERALDKANSAVSISQSALSPEDWKLVVSQWQEAIALMQAVPANNPQKALSRTKIAQYQRSLAYAKQQVTRPIQSSTEQVVVLSPQSASLPQSKLPEQGVFQAPIKRRVSGTPVIDVTINGEQQVEMIVDTGASGTMLTQAAANALGVLPIGTAKGNTASAKGVEFPIGHVNSISVGGTTVQDLFVAIAGSDLDTGLLGHDFFGNYDVTIKRDVVEFRAR